MEVNILLFDEFETLDAFGVVEILGKVEEYKLHYYSLHGGKIASAQNVSINTEDISHAAKEGILVIPGGRGTRRFVDDPMFLSILKEVAEESKYCLSVCTGSALLAKTGLLDGKSATSNKKAFEWVTAINPNVNWVRKARWMVDGKYYTSSGVSAGMDMALGFIQDCFGVQEAIKIATHIEYIWNSESSKDIFA